MTTKKPTTKKPVKTIVIPSQATAPFDLTLENKEENERIAMALQSLKSNSGWIFLVQVFKENMRLLGDQIIKKADLDGKPLTEAQADEARYKHAIFEEVLGKPDFYLKKFQPPLNPEDNLDPYHQSTPEKP